MLAQWDNLRVYSAKKLHNNAAVNHSGRGSVSIINTDLLTFLHANTVLCPSVPLIHYTNRNRCRDRGTWSVVTWLTITWKINEDLQRLYWLRLNIYSIALAMQKSIHHTCLQSPHRTDNSLQTPQGSTCTEKSEELCVCLLGRVTRTIFMQIRHLDWPSEAEMWTGFGLDRAVR